MKLPVRRELDAIIADTMTPALEGVGFSRRGHDFLRLADDHVVQVLSVQTSQRSTETLVSWTYNLGGYIPELLEIRGIARPDATPDASGCFLHIRLQTLCPDRGGGTETWYDLGDDGAALLLRAATYRELGYDPRRADTVRRRVRADLVELVVPFFDRARSWRDWYALVCGPNGHEASAFEHLVLALLTDDLASARTTYRATFRGRPEVRRYVRQRFGVDLHET